MNMDSKYQGMYYQLLKCLPITYFEVIKAIFSLQKLKPLHSIPTYKKLHSHCHPLDALNMKDRIKGTFSFAPLQFVINTDEMLTYLFAGILLQISIGI